jgi:acetylornithine deacetylase
MKIDRDYLFSTLADLIRINSINPTLAATGPGEVEIGDYVATALGSLGLDVQKLESQPGRASVLGILRGTSATRDRASNPARESGDARNLMLNAHYDTVGIEGMAEPFSAAIRDGKMFGRGSYDMKGSLAAQMAAVKAIVDSGERPRGDVIIAAVADEEYGSIGTFDVIRHFKDNTQINAAIVTEPTAARICLAHKGYLWIEIETIGCAAHGSKFESGIDANMMMGRFLSELDKLERDLRARSPHPLLGPPSLHAAMIHGGEGLSTYAASCKLQIERRTIPGETEAQVVRELQEIVDRLATGDSSFQASIRSYFVRDPFEIPRDAAVVRAVDRASARVLARAPEYIGDTPWMDAALLQAAGIETVVIGPAGGGAHAAVEWVELESVAQIAAILAETAMDFCA